MNQPEKNLLVLGLESSCDETACAVVRNGVDILSNVVASQFDLHAAYGGVVPELACRRHVDLIIPIIDEALSQARIALSDIDLFAVAHGPGLIGALLIGLNTAKALSLAQNKPLVGINHVEAHLYAAIMSLPQFPVFPCLGVVLSGGHTALVLIHAIGHYEMVSQTVDDAIGEAFDKVAKLLNLPYPGGPEIERLASTGNPFRYSLRAGTVKGHPLAFSFSGLKTAVLYTIKGTKGEQSPTLTDQDRADLAASFQRAAFDDIIKKAQQAANIHHVNTLIFGGGVTNNQTLRRVFDLQCPQLQCIWPPFGLSLDNAAMIAGLGYHRFLRKNGGDSIDLEPMTRLPLSNL